jgi:uncharacterized protein
MAGKFVLKKSSNDQYYFSLKAGNGETILSSEMYESKGSAESGIVSVKKNAPLDERYEKRTSSRDQPYFVLKAANGQIIGTSEMYSSTSARDNGIESVKKNAPEAETQDLT